MENRHSQLLTNPEAQITPEQQLVEKIDDIFTANTSPEDMAKYTSRMAYVHRTERGDKLAAVADSKYFRVANMPPEQGEHRVKITVVTDMKKYQTGQSNATTRYLTITRGPTEKDSEVRTTVIKLADGEDPMQFTHASAAGTEKRPKALRERTRDNALAFLKGAVLVPQEPRRKNHSVALNRPPEDNDFAPRWREGMQKPELTPTKRQQPAGSEASLPQLMLNRNGPIYPKIISGESRQMSPDELQRAAEQYKKNREILG